MPTLPFLCTATPLSSAGFQSALNKLGIDATTLWTMMDIETGSCGYLADRRPQILFERHLFSRATGGQFDASHPDISNPVAGGYGAGGANQYVRMGEAAALDQDAALSSASWGLGQVLGSNFAPTFASTSVMVESMCGSEDAQLQSIVDFVLARRLQGALKNKQWAVYASGYNGPSYTESHYDLKLAAQYAKYVAGTPLPDLNVRAGQIYLSFLGHSPIGTDGILGAMTLMALHNFQAAKGIPPTATIDAGTLATLKAAVPAATNLLLG